MTHDLQAKQSDIKSGAQAEGVQTPDEAPGGENSVKIDQDPQVMQLLNDVVNFRLGQTIDDVRGNAVILSGIACCKAQTSQA